MNLFTILLALAAGWSARIIYTNMFNSFSDDYVEEVGISNEERDMLLKAVPEEIKRLNTILMVALNYMADWIENLQERALPEDKRMTKEQWVKSAVEQAQRDLLDNNSISK